MTFAQEFAPTPLYPEAPDYTTGEARLLETLRGGEQAEKAIACKQLAIHGTKQAVPELARLLHDEQLASWARIALEAIPDPAADEALLKAAESLEGNLLVGAINSLGVRRSAAAVGPLAPRLNHPQAEVISAAAIALGRIGGDEATKALRAALPNTTAAARSEVAEACILCAERLLAEGKADEAAAIYDEVRTAEVPKQRIVEATRGAILAREADGIPLLVKQLKSSDKTFFNLGLSTARELEHSQVTEALADLLASSQPDRAALLLTAIGDRADVTPPGVIAAARRGEPQVRIAALGVIGRSKDAVSVTDLLQIAAESNAEVAEAAKSALAQLASSEIDQQLIAQLPKTEGAALAALIEVIGRRRVEATDELVKSLDSDDRSVRSAALTALGETVGPEDLDVLITETLSAKDAEAAEAAARALKAASVRMPDQNSAAAKLAAALPKASPAAKQTLLEILGAVGGPTALETIAATVKSGDAKLQDAGTRVLGEWMTADAAPVLLELAKDPAVEKYQVRSLRGFLRIARQFALPDGERIQMAKQALEAAERIEERQLALQVLERSPTPAALEVAIEARERRGLEDAANKAAMVIVLKLVEQGADPESLLAKIGQEPMDIKIDKAEYGDGRTSRDVTDVLQQHVRGLPVIPLGATFNKAFGGDPAPTAPKWLTVNYTINGKAGETRIAENQSIVLPMPE
ncbi:MAG TPA: HEAT repeat domain-containing protein [Lacipirellula sp.]